MQLRILLVLTMLLNTLLTSSSCVTSYDYSMEISCEEFTENHHYRTDYKLEVGDKIRLELCSNPTTGFEWEYQMTQENVLIEEDYDFEEPEAGVVGAAGVELWTFEAVEKGTTEVRMEYSQPWKDGLKAEWTYTMNVTVEYDS